MACEKCLNWFHLKCVGLLQPPAEDYICKSCLGTGVCIEKLNLPNFRVCNSMAVAEFKQGRWITNEINFPSPDSRSKLEVFTLTSSHPAFPGYGARVVAGQSIQEGEIVAYYAGIIQPGISSISSLYAWVLSSTDDSDNAPVVDAERQGNISRFFNCAMNTGKKANCNSELVNIYVSGRSFPCVRIFATTTIVSGEEVLIHYGKQYWSSYMTQKT